MQVKLFRFSGYLKIVFQIDLRQIIPVAFGAD